MEITNEHGLPWPIVAAVKRDPYCSGRSDITATTVIGPPQIRILRQRHHDEIKVDVVDRVWALAGSLGHAILERAAGRDPGRVIPTLVGILRNESLTNDERVSQIREMVDAAIERDRTGPIVERRLYMVVGDWVLGGQLDLVAPSPDSSEYVLSDYKWTSVWTWIYGGRREWDAQLNIYLHLCRKHGIFPAGAEIVCVFRDWMRSKAKFDRSYPQTKALTLPVPDWGEERTQAFIEERVRLHQEAELLPDEELPPCTPEERWESGEIFAVKREGRKRAMNGGLFGTEAEALEFIAKQRDPESCYVEHRPATPNRCPICEVAPFCHQWQNDPRNPSNQESEVN